MTLMVVELCGVLEFDVLPKPLFVFVKDQFAEWTQQGVVVFFGLEKCKC